MIRGFRTVKDILGPFVGSAQHHRFDYLAGRIQNLGSGDALIEAIDALISLRLQSDPAPCWSMDIASQHLASGGSPHTPRMEAVEHRLREALSNAPFNSDERRAMIAQVEQLNRRLGYARAKDAVQAGHYPQYEVLLATWDMLYGPFGKTTDETREGNAPERSGGPELQSPVDDREPPLGHAFVHGRLDPEDAGVSGAGRVSHDQTDHNTDGGGSGDSGGSSGGAD